MQKFNSLKSIPAYLPIVNIDTDMIIPKQFLKTIKRTGLGKNLFFEIRYDNDGKEIKDFILNQEPHNKSKILITGKNFGCGSSREHAPWALLDFGITCVISSSYADIFYNNCFKNGILPIVLEEEKIKELSEYSKRKQEISIDLKEDKIFFGNKEIKFEIDSFKKKCLFGGLDDIALSLEKVEKISSFEDLILLSSKKKEINLKYDLENNVNLIKFSERKIDISFNENLDKNFVRNLSEKLLEWTGRRWVITLSKEKGQRTFSELKNIKKKELLNQEKEGEIYKKFKNIFSDGELVKVSKKD